MATGQNSFSFTSYGETLSPGPNPSSIYAYTQAQYKSLSVAGTQVIGINPTTVGTATCNAIVQVLPTGLNVKGKFFLTDSTEAALALLRT